MTQGSDDSGGEFPASVHGLEAPDTLAGQTLSANERAVYSRMFLDRDATLLANQRDEFPFSPGELVELAKITMLRVFMGLDFSLLSDDFKFVGPVVGPLSRAEFIRAFGTAQVYSAFPDATSGIHDIRVDPHMPNRVFYTTVFDGVHSGKFMGRIEPTEKRVRLPPQDASITFNAQGKVTRLTPGYVIDREVGNSGGLGGLFGILWAIGKPFPFPEARPFSKSWQFRLFEWVGSFFFTPNRSIEDSSLSDSEPSKKA